MMRCIEYAQQNIIRNTVMLELSPHIPSGVYGLIQPIFFFLRKIVLHAIFLHVKFITIISYGQSEAKIRPGMK